MACATWHVCIAHILHCAICQLFDKSMKGKNQLEATPVICKVVDLASSMHYSGKVFGQFYWYQVEKLGIRKPKNFIVPSLSRWGVITIQ